MKLKYFISMASIVGLMYGCIDDELFDQTKEAASNEVTVLLNLGGEILVADEPMTRGENDPDIYGIQVYKDGEPFAHGVLDHVDNLKINMLKGGSYKIVVSMIKNGVNLLCSEGNMERDETFSYDINKNGYRVPNSYFGELYAFVTYPPYYKFFVQLIKNNAQLYLDGYKYDKIKYIKPKEGTITYTLPFAFAGGEYMYPHLFENKMMYNGEKAGDNFELNMLGISATVLADGKIWKYPEVDRFYGEIDNYVPQSNGSLTIDMKRTGFGLKCQVTGITDGSVHVKIENDSRVFFEDEAITDDTISDEKVFTFANVRDAWLYADNYEEKLRVTVDWLRGIGITENLGTATISVKRNTMNKVRINLGAVDNSSSLSINVEDDAYINNNSIEIPFAQ